MLFFRFVGPHFALALQNAAIDEHQFGSDYIGKNSASLLDFKPLPRVNLTFHKTCYAHDRHINFSVDLSMLADNQKIVRMDFANQLAIDSQRVFKFYGPGDRNSAINKSAQISFAQLICSGCH